MARNMLAARDLPWNPLGRGLLPSIRPLAELGERKREGKGMGVLCQLQLLGPPI